MIRQKPAFRLCESLPCYLYSILIGCILMLLSIPVCCCGETAAPEVRIRSINIESFDVFDTSDPDASAWVYRMINALHIRSKQRFIRSVLLFRENDVFDEELLKESARLLRSTRVFDPVYITHVQDREGIDVNVETHDQWTTEASVNYSLFGNRQTGGFALAEDNFLGWGKKLEISYTRDDERSTRMIEYEDPVFFSTRWTLAVKHQDTSDGSVNAIKCIHPFFTTKTRFAGGVEYIREEVDTWLWSEGKKRVSGNEYRRTGRLWAGMALLENGDLVQRLSIGYAETRTKFSDWEWKQEHMFDTPENQWIAGPDVEWECTPHHYRVIRGFRAWHHQEDVEIGTRWSVRLGFPIRHNASISTVAPFKTKISYSGLTPNYYHWINSVVTGRTNSKMAEDTVFSLNLGLASLGKSSFRIRLSTDISHNLDRDRQMALGADTGLRGWNPDYFDGTSRMICNLEWRRQLTEEIFNLFVIGSTVFIDAGCTWNPRIGKSTCGLRSNAGIGISIEVTRASLTRIGRFEIGFPDDGGSPVFLISTSTLF